MDSSLKIIDDYIKLKDLQINHTPFENIELGFGKLVVVEKEGSDDDYSILEFTIDKNTRDRLNRSSAPTLIEIVGKEYECAILDLEKNHLSIAVQNYAGKTNRKHKAKFLVDMSFIFEKQKKVLGELKTDEHQNLRALLFGNREIKGGEQIECTYENEHLNECQKKAISCATGVKDIFLIWGPPGTGKTTIVPEIIKNYFDYCISGEKKQTILVCGWTNTAVDNIVQKLYEKNKTVIGRGKRVIRYGKGTTLNKKKYKEVLYDSQEKRCIDKIGEKYKSELHHLKSKKDNILQKIKDSENHIANSKNRILELKEQSYSAVKGLECDINLEIETLNNSIKSFFEIEISKGQKQIKPYKSELDDLKVECGNTLKNIEELNKSSAKYESSISDFDAEIHKLEQKKEEQLDILDVIEKYLSFINHNKFKYSLYLKGLYSSPFLKELKKYELYKKDYDSVYLHKKDVEQKLITLYSQKSDAIATKTETSELKDELKKRLDEEEKAKKSLEAKQSRLKQEIEKKNEKIMVLLRHLVSIEKAQMGEIANFSNFIHLIEDDKLKNRLPYLQKNVVDKRIKIDKIKREFASSHQINTIQIKTLSDSISTFQKDIKSVENSIGLLNANKETELENITSLVLERYDIIATTIFETPRIFNLIDFDLTIIDEAGAVEIPNALIPIIKSKKVILLGDHKQIQPIIRENATAVKSFLNNHKYMKDSIFKLLKDKINNNVNCLIMLKEQYRMRKDIADFISEVFYDNDLKTSNNVDSNLSDSLDKVVGAEPQLVWFLREYWNEKVNSSYRSRLEVELIKNIVGNFKKRYGDEITDDIAVITPFREQYKLIKDELPEIECGTVHQFQGQERKIIIFSPAESNRFGPLFSGDSGKTLLNVVISRAQQKFIIIGSDKIKKLPKYKQLYTHIGRTGWISEELIEDYDPSYKCPICGKVMYSPRYEFCRECGDIKKLQNSKFNENKMYKCTDGDMVRSNGEVRIDDWLSENKIEHICEKKLPISDLLYCDWYLPKYDVYIEFWGSIHFIDEGTRRRYKENLYKKNDLKLISIEDADLINLNDRLNHEIGKLKVSSP